MRSVFVTLFLSILIYSLNFDSSNAVSSEEICEENVDESELVLVSVIFRHGARTTYSFYPNDPYKDEKFYPYGLGHLTNEGKMGEYKLGKYLYKYYNKHIGEDWSEEKVSVRSSDVSRTKMSALLVLAGLFPPSKALTWNPELKWLPIPVEYKPEHEEDIFHPKCDYKNKVLEDQDNIPEVQERFINPYKEIYKYVEEKSGKKINNPHDMIDFYFIVRAEVDMNYTLPEWTKGIYPRKIEEASIPCYEYHNYDPDVMKINTGYMIKKILNDCKDKIENKDNEKKIFLYSGHESTLGYMLVALKVVEPHIPPYGSALAFELRKKNDKYYIKMIYRDDTESMTGKILQLPGCEVLCPYDQFVNLLDYLIPTKTIQEICKQNYTSYAKKEP